MSLNLISIMAALSKVHQINSESDDAISNMNIKINPGFFDKSNNSEKMSSSSTSSTSPSMLLGLKNKITPSIKRQNNHDNDTTNQNNEASTIHTPLPFHSHKELALAERSIQKLVEDSHFFPPGAAREDWFHRSLHGGEATKVTTLYESELQVGRMLGRGGFCQVRLVNLKNGNGCTTNNNEYAIKYLQPISKSKSSFARGAADLAIEARFLSLLSHENIISLHHISAGTLAETYNCLDAASIKDEDCFKENEAQEISPSLRTYGYFLILDYLRDTLLQRIQNLYIPSMISHGFTHPKAHHNKHRCHYGQHCDSSNDNNPKREVQLHWWNRRLWQRNFTNEEKHNRKMVFLQDSLRKRLRILRQIASALEYLHSIGIVYRDGKSR